MSIEKERSMKQLAQIDLLQLELVNRWHQCDPEPGREGLLGLVEKQHLQNYLLWHEEDKARDPHVNDQEIAGVKRSIDKLNQSRNDLIESLDEAILAKLQQEGFVQKTGVPANSETPGSIIDRSSIMALKVYHMKEQTIRTDVGRDHLETAAKKVHVLQTQREDLLTCLLELIDEVRKGTRQFKIYRQFKMYNDPSLNPRIYQAGDKKG
jgi:uncharacterized protein DUF4254